MNGVLKDFTMKGTESNPLQLDEQEWGLVRYGENLFCCACTRLCGPGLFSRFSDSLRAGRSGDRIPVAARFSTPVQTGPGAHPTSYTMGTGSFPGVKSGRGVTLAPHPLLVAWSRKSRAMPLLRLWAVRRGVDHPPPSSAEVKERV